MVATSSKCAILIVEDDAMIAMLLAEMLEAMGHSVCAIEATEAGAVAAALAHRPGLMIVDAHLQQGSGVAAVTAILATQSIPCILVSGDIAEVLGQSPRAVMLAKPYSEAGLAAAISRAVAS
ncbi:response regulator [Polymorphobacter arshaanensis]|uniref:Response regulator n=1 Tax=Glacieibacterium arshaanense TaxID=2511025 RepID=A0A4Y9EK25_9SPHN|nr:response regulator [Polymorphobacter arshaanensis]TFU01018.1 response regulator [Polymorphobacter arshaanensis]